MKTCTRCKVAKDPSLFGKDKSRWDGLAASCRECRTQWRAENLEAERQRDRDRYHKRSPEQRDRKNAHQRERYRENPEPVLSGQRKRRAENPEHVRAIEAQSKAKKKATDPTYGLLQAARCRVSQFLRGIMSKPESITKAFGCDSKTLWAHLEFHLRDGMSLENYGTVWHIDHFYPLSKANLGDRAEYLAVCNYRNLRPTFCAENIGKGGRILPEAEALFEQLKQELA